MTHQLIIIPELVKLYVLCQHQKNILSLSAKSAHIPKIMYQINVRVQVTKISLTFISLSEYAAK